MHCYAHVRVRARVCLKTESQEEIDEQLHFSDLRYSDEIVT